MRICIIQAAASDNRSRLQQVLKHISFHEEGEPGCKETFWQEAQIIKGANEFRAWAEAGKLKDSRLIFAVELPASGINIEAYKLLEYLQGSEKNLLKGSVAGVIVDGETELYTKDMGRRLVFAANMQGCSFPGKALVEATGDLSNFKVLARLWGTSLEEAYKKSCRLLAGRVCDFSFAHYKTPAILAIHAGSHSVSNSLSLWRLVAEELKGKASIEEISVRNGQVWDCRGCKYEDCFHFGEQGTCFYGGVMADKVYPAIIKCDILVLICPNYNDSVSANIMAFINRLTSVFRVNDLSRKQVYAAIVSGYSGGDIVAQQVIGAMNMNKNFMLPASFAMMETANDPGEAEKLPGIEERAKEFAERILNNI